MKNKAILSAGLLSIACWSHVASAQIGSALKYEAAELKQHFQNQAVAYKIVAAGNELELNQQPLMQWSNPIRSQEQGSLYVWSLNDRPHVLASIFSYEYNGMVFCRHELQSLSDGPISATLDGVEVWSPDQPGLKRNRITDVPKPSDSAARRLIRMRSIARQFSGTLRIQGNQPSELTLKPQPVLRYSSAKDGIIDGAVFSLAVATDPEIWLVIEASKDEHDDPVWSFAAVRSHFQELELRRGDVPVWNAPAVLALRDTREADEPYASGSYFSFHTRSAIPAPETLR